MSEQSTPPYRRVDQGIVLVVRVSPNASKEGIGGLWQGADAGNRAVEMALQVKVRAQPQDGQANKAVIAVIAKALGVPRSSLSIISGPKDRLKQVLIEGEPSILEPAIRELISSGA